MSTKAKQTATKQTWQDVPYTESVVTSSPTEATVRCPCGHGIVRLAVNADEQPCPECGRGLRLRTVLEASKP